MEISGVCMWPVLREGDLLLCEPLGELAPNLGDVLVAPEGSRFVAHRLQRIYGPRSAECLVLQGDLAGPDAPRKRGDILGRALLVYRTASGTGPPRLLDIAPPAVSSADLGLLGSGLLRRVASWQTRARLARNVDRIRPALPLDVGDVLA